MSSLFVTTLIRPILGSNKKFISLFNQDLHKPYIYIIWQKKEHVVDFKAKAAFNLHHYCLNKVNPRDNE